MRRLLVAALALLVGAALSGAGSAYAAHGGPGRGMGGQVTAIEGTTITVNTPKGAASIATTESTTFELDGASASLSSLSVGMFVRAEGTRDASGSFTATRVVASSSRPTPPAGWPHPRR